ncbi:MAG: S-DNA-T family DNA segregation ATPase FtsK/SpoIIIE, partial [Flavobacteriales bacterium]
MKNKPKNQKKSSTKNTKKAPKKPSSSPSFGGIKSFFFGKEFKTVLSIFLLCCGVLMAFGFFSYLMHWKADHSLLSLSYSEYYLNKEIKAENGFGKLGAIFSHMFIYKGFGIASFTFTFLLVVTAVKLQFKTKFFPFFKTTLIAAISIALFSIFSGFFLDSNLLIGGSFGYQTKIWMTSLLGNVGTGAFILFSIISFAIFIFKPNFSIVVDWIESLIPAKEEELTPVISEDGFTIVDSKMTAIEEEVVAEAASEVVDFSVPGSVTPLLTEQTEVPSIEMESAVANAGEADVLESSILDELLTESGPGDGIPLSMDVIDSTANESQDASSSDSEFTVEVPKEEEVLSNKEVNKLVEEYGEYDPTLELSNYKYPSIEILQDHGNHKLSVSKEELEKNKDRIVETLSNYNIGIAKIKATIGPTVTLYEIVPEKGIRISKIKNLEDDIAMSLSALGIRIIAPIPGRGTVGIEVPNSSPDIVSMKSLIASDKFQSSKMLLPIALGKTISNETYIADLAKMPHLLMAGATGQGKSVGLNAILVSLLYKKHPSQIKFVMVDPKKVELTLFNKIERHYLAKLPDEAEAIITDTDKVVKTLKSLTKEMDERYELLKNGMVRNLEEYNAKFVARKLNPENGHRYLPYIVLIVDEFADLMMTAGKEVEAPIARLAQLARAIGIHLIIATQRPSVNIITGT